jgi:hypothetical protein
LGSGGNFGRKFERRFSETKGRVESALPGLLEGNLLKQVHVLTEEERMHRELLRTRQEIVGHRSDVARQIKSKLLFHGISSEPAEKHPWNLKYVQWLKGLSLGSQYLKESLEVLIDLYGFLSKQLMRINRRVA